MRSYELMIIIKPDLPESEVKKVTDKVKEYLTKKTAKKVKEDIWGKRNLAYKIDKYSEGYYVVLNFDLNPDDCVGLKELLNLEESLLRHMTTIVE